MTKRGVPVKGQLRSHKMFAKSIEKYISVVDAAKIYSTSAWNGPAEVKMITKNRLDFPHILDMRSDKICCSCQDSRGHFYFVSLLSLQLLFKPAVAGRPLV